MISVTILTRNSSKYIEEVLSALQSFDEIVVYDSGSLDNTMEIAKKFSNVSLYQGTFDGFGPTHNKASNLAKHDWILSIDSDEVATPELVNEIKKLNLTDKNSVYSIPRNNYYNGKWIRYCGWHPDRVIRLYNRTTTHFSNDQVHERVLSDNCHIVKLEAALKHYSYHSTADFLAKMESYSTLFAKQNSTKKKSSVCKATLHGFFAFFKSYFIKRGFLAGKEGFIISVYNGNTAFYKYLKLWEQKKG